MTQYGIGVLANESVLHILGYMGARVRSEACRVGCRGSEGDGDRWESVGVWEVQKRLVCQTTCHDWPQRRHRQAGRTSEITTTHHEQGRVPA